MPHLVVRHKVADYEKWKAVFDEHGSIRKAMGFKGGLVLRNVDDPNEVIMVLQVEDIGKARQFTQSADRETMQRAGVTDRPDIYFTDEADRPPA